MEIKLVSPDFSNFLFNNTVYAAFYNNAYCDCNLRIHAFLHDSKTGNILITCKTHVVDKTSTGFIHEFLEIHKHEKVFKFNVPSGHSKHIKVSLNYLWK